METKVLELACQKQKTKELELACQKQKLLYETIDLPMPIAGIIVSFITTHNYAICL